MTSDSRCVSNVVCTGVCGDRSHKHQCTSSRYWIHVVIFCSYSLHIRILHHVSIWTSWFPHNGVATPMLKKLSTLQKPLLWISYTSTEKTNPYTSTPKGFKNHTSTTSHIGLLVLSFQIPLWSKLYQPSVLGDTSPGLQWQKSRKVTSTSPRRVLPTRARIHTHTCAWLFPLYHT